jgi:hypothetical protein
MIAVDTPFYAFAFLLGLVIGALVVWFLMVEHPFETPEVPGGPADSLEAPMIVKALADDGVTVDEAAVERVVALHQAYFSGRIHESLAAAEAARIDAERARIAAAEASQQAAQKGAARTRRKEPRTRAG